MERIGNGRTSEAEADEPLPLVNAALPLPFLDAAVAVEGTLRNPCPESRRTVAAAQRYSGSRAHSCRVVISPLRRVTVQILAIARLALGLYRSGNSIRSRDPILPWKAKDDWRSLIAVFSRILSGLRMPLRFQPRRELTEPLPVCPSKTKVHSLPEN